MFAGVPAVGRLQVDAAMQQQDAAADDGRRDAGGMRVDEQDGGFRRHRSRRAGERAGHDGAGLEAGFAGGGFVLREHVARDGDGEHAHDLFAGAHDLEADHGVVGVEGQELLEAEADDGESFGKLVGQRVEVEQQDADGGVGNDEREVVARVGTDAEVFERFADSGGDGDAVNDVAGLEARGDGSGSERDAGDGSMRCGGGRGTGGDDALRRNFAGETRTGSGGLGEKVHAALTSVPRGAVLGRCLGLDAREVAPLCNM